MLLCALMAVATASPPSPAPPAPEARTVRLVAAGDVLPHRRVKATARASGWSAVFEGITPRVQAADLAFANLESPVAPDHHKGIHGEVFNAPADLLPGLAAAGFDVLSMANNHAYDQGPDGLVETRERVVAAGMTPVGAGPDCATARSVAIREVEGLRIGFLAFADLTNIDANAGTEAPCVAWAGPVCEGDCGPDRDAIHFRPDAEGLRREVTAAAAATDLLVVSFHWGDEYRTAPLPEYPPLARVLVDAGADVVLGHHPHVLQPLARVPREGAPDAVVAYSLGNLVSDMGSRFDPTTQPATKGHTRDGLVLGVDARFEGRRLVALTMDAWPVWTENNRLEQGDAPDRVVVVPVEALSEPLRGQRKEAIEAIVGATDMEDAPR